MALLATYPPTADPEHGHHSSYMQHKMLRTTWGGEYVSAYRECQYNISNFNFPPSIHFISFFIHSISYWNEGVIILKLCAHKCLLVMFYLLYCLNIPPNNLPVVKLFDYLLTNKLVVSLARLL